MPLVKRYEELTLADKIFYLHSLHPQGIKAFLIFVTEHIAWITEDSDRLIEKLGVPQGPSWHDILQSLNEHIGSSFDDLVDSPFYFVDTFSKGNNQFFFLHCIHTYDEKAYNDLFIKAIHYFFDF